MPTNDQPWNGGEGNQMDDNNGQYGQGGGQGGSQGNGQGGSHSAGTRERVSQIRDNARSVVDDSRSVITDGIATVTDRMTTHPYQTMLIAAGVGYLLGGGLFTGLTVRLLRTGIRMAAMPLVRNELVNLASSVTARSSD